jgi:hypothetical protein
MTESGLAIAAPRTLDIALLKAVGLDRAAPEQRDLAIAIAGRYELDLMLKHLVLIEGRPYLTRDALLHIAHRSGQFDGIGTTTPEVVGDEWRCTATVWRKDMTHPFVYGGRYPAKGGNQKFAPEMAIKVAESMALRRAFNVAAPVAEERWDVDVPSEPAAAAKPSLVARLTAKPAPAPEPEEPEELFGEAVEVVEVAAGPPPPVEAPTGLSEPALAAIARQAGKTKGQIAVAIGAIGKPVPSPVDVSAAMLALTDEERGRLADELNLSWRDAA